MLQNLHYLKNSFALCKGVSLAGEVSSSVDGGFSGVFKAFFITMTGLEPLDAEMPYGVLVVLRDLKTFSGVDLSRVFGVATFNNLI